MRLLTIAVLAGGLLGAAAARAAPQAEPRKEPETAAERVRKALDRAESPEFSDEQLTSIVFPLLGSGRGKAEFEETAMKLIPEAVAYLERPEGSRLKRVYFVALTESQRDACKLVFSQLARDKRVTPAEGDVAPAPQGVAAAAP